jgi:predicted PurR-regulated permease PerM
MHTAQAKTLAGWIILLVALAVIVVWIAYLAFDALLLVYISVLLAIGLSPLVSAIERGQGPKSRSGRPPRWLAILLIYVVIIGGLTMVGFTVVPMIVEQGRELWIELPSLLDRAQTYLIERGILREPITLEQAVRPAPQAVGKVATAITRVFAAIFSVVTVLILTFYLVLESRTLLSEFARVFPRVRRRQVIETFEKMSAKVSACLIGQLILGVTIGATAAAGLYLLGVPYFYVLAVIAGAGELVPIIGPVVSSVPAILVALTVSPKTALFVALFWLLQQQLENHLLVPKLMQHQVGVSPVFVITALVIGGSLLGVVGAVLAVPTAAIIQVLLQELLDERDREAV